MGAVWVVFGQTLGYGFVNYDDSAYVYENPEVARGLTFQGIVWAFTHVYAANWHPLTWISHMLDCQLYGLSPGGHHLTNILLHAATAIVLFLVLRQMTGALWRSAFVAAVFAIHPLRVESVAWVSERKDVLSGLLFILTLGVYVRYVEKSKVQSPKSKVYYGLTLLFFVLGLMCKPMLVTVPFVLLLLDYWPLGRMTGDEWQVTGEKKGKPSTLNPQPSTLLLEKLPLFGLAVAACVATLFTQKAAIQPFEQISLPMRVGNGLISYVAYLGQMFWPSGLAVFYPFAARGVETSRVVLSLVLLACISTGVFVLRRRRYFLTGWLWYLIMLVPVIGIVQVGSQARADRYTYLPQIGLYVLLTWAAADLCAGWRHRRVMLGGIAAIVIASLSVDSFLQTAYWRDSESLWTHTLACTSDNLIAHNNLGKALFKKGNVNEAIAHYQKALQIKPDSAEIRDNLGIALAKAHGDYANKLVGMGRDDEAIVEFKEALELFPDYADARHDLAIILLHKGQVDEAIAQFLEIWKQYPDEEMASFDLGNAYFQKGQMDAAVAFYQRALKIKPDDVSARNNLGMAFLRKGMVDEAVTQFREVLAIQPDFTLARTNLNKALGVGTEQDQIKAR